MRWLWTLLFVFITTLAFGQSPSQLQVILSRPAQCANIVAQSGGTYDSIGISGWSTTNATLKSPSNATVSPDCSLDAGVLTEDITAASSHSSNHIVSFTTAVQSYTYTSYARRVVGSRDYRVDVFSSTFGSDVFLFISLATCSITSGPTASGTFASPTATVTRVGVTPWCKIVLSFTGIVDTSQNLVAGLVSGVSSSYDGNGTSSIAVWGVDLR